MATAITPEKITSVDPRTPIRYVAILTGAAAIDHTVSPQDDFRIVKVELHLNAAPTTSQSFVVKLDAGDGLTYDAVQLSEDLTVGSVTDLVSTPEKDNVFEADDVIAITWTNTDLKTYGLRLIYELV